MSENNVKKSHSSHRRSSRSSHHRSSHSSTDRNSNYRSKRVDASSEMERRGENIIYDKVRKEKLKLMIKRTVFCVLSIAIIFYLVISILSSGDSSTDFGFFNKGVSIEEVNELNNKIVKYEFYIEELEERLSEYEDVDGMFVKSKKQEH